MSSACARASHSTPSFLTAFTSRAAPFSTGRLQSALQRSPARSLRDWPFGATSPQRRSRQRLSCRRLSRPVTKGSWPRLWTRPYEAGARGGAWLKIKPAVTLDLVVLAAEWGHGRLTGWLSNLHLGARNPNTGAFVMLGKTFKGMTDEMLAWQTAELTKLAIARDRHTVYVEPKLVVEIAFNDIQA